VVVIAYDRTQARSFGLDQIFPIEFPIKSDGAY